MRSIHFTAFAIVPVALALSGCSQTAATTDAIAIDSSDTACTVETLTVPPGATTFAITNTGSETTELYVYRTDGSILAEAESITPGLTKDLTATLEAGTYELACKPGERDPGFRQRLTVATPDQP